MHSAHVFLQTATIPSSHYGATYVTGYPLLVEDAYQAPGALIGSGPNLIPMPTAEREQLSHGFCDWCGARSSHSYCSPACASAAIWREVK